MSHQGIVSTEQVYDIDSNQEETDTRVVLYAQFAASQGYETIRVRSPDSDIYFILLHHASSINATVLFDTGTGNKRRLLNVTQHAKELGQKHCSALLGLHAMTGCDTCSSLKGIGKKKPIKILHKYPQFEDCLSAIGEDWDIPENIMTQIEEFVCCMFGNPRFKFINRLRYHLIMKKCDNEESLNPKRKIDFGSLPPCQSSLRQHIIRVNYQVT